MATSEALPREREITVDAEVMHERVAAMTRQIFGGPAAIRCENDPDFPSRYFVVYATVKGEVDDIVQLNQRWHATIGEVAGAAADQYRLTFELA